MIGLLTQYHQQVVKTCRGALAMAQAACDKSAALVSDRMRIHDNTASMLRALR